jgi:hypothetical protein
MTRILAYHFTFSRQLVNLNFFLLCKINFNLFTNILSFSFRSPCSFITTFLYWSLRTPALPHSDLRSKFHRLIINEWLSGLPRIFWTYFIPSTLFISLNFLIPNSIPNILSFFFCPEIVTDYCYWSSEWRGGTKRNFPTYVLI